MELDRGSLGAPEPLEIAPGKDAGHLVAAGSATLQTEHRLRDPKDLDLHTKKARRAQRHLNGPCLQVLRLIGETHFLGVLCGLGP